MNYNNVPCTLADFSTGLLAGLASIGITSISTTGLDKRVEKAFHAWEHDAEKAGLNIRFRIITDELHGDCPPLRISLGEAVSRGLGYYDEGDQLHILASPRTAAMYLECVPGNYKLWEALARLVAKR